MGHNYLYVDKKSANATDLVCIVEFNKERIDMKTVNGNIIIEVNMNIKLFISKDEAKALHAIAGYGADSFLEMFYKELGKAYLQDYEKPMRSLFKKLDSELPIEISKIEKAEKQINEAVDLLKSNNQ